MAIETMGDGGFMVTGEHIQVYQLLALKARLKIEAVGLGFRGRSTLSIVKDLTGLRARSAKDMVPKYEDWLRERGILADKEV